MNATAMERFWGKVAKADCDGCWHWLGAKNSSGYGSFTIGRQHKWMVHRFAYEHFIGPIPPGLTIDHLCRNTACVNPWHMEAVTQRVNNRRGNGMSGIHARKTHCAHGHPLEGDNLLPWALKRGWRRCRVCYALRVRSCVLKRRGMHFSFGTVT